MMNKNVVIATVLCCLVIQSKCSNDPLYPDAPKWDESFVIPNYTIGEQPKVNNEERQNHDLYPNVLPKIEENEKTTLSITNKKINGGKTKIIQENPSVKKRIGTQSIVKETIKDVLFCKNKKIFRAIGTIFKGGVTIENVGSVNLDGCTFRGIVNLYTTGSVNLAGCTFRGIVNLYTTGSVEGVGSCFRGDVFFENVKKRLELTECTFRGKRSVRSCVEIKEKDCTCRGGDIVE